MDGEDVSFLIAKNESLQAKIQLLQATAEDEGQYYVLLEIIRDLREQNKELQAKNEVLEKQPEKRRIWVTHWYDSEGVIHAVFDGQVYKQVVQKWQPVEEKE